MEINKTRKIESLSKGELDTLIDLYYDSNLIEDEQLIDTLVEKNLVSTEISKEKNKIFLTNSGLDLCTTLMVDKINSKKEEFENKISNLSERGISVLVNRIIYHNNTQSETSKIEPVNEIYNFDESLWYEKVLLNSDRFISVMNSFYDILSDIGFVKTVDSEKYSSPEVEEFLKNRFKDVMDLTWSEEDFLKYYYFFYIYASDQKNLINFSGDCQDYRSMFFSEKTSSFDFWFSNNRSNPKSLLYNLGLSEKRVISFLLEMKEKGIVNERNYPLSSFSFFSDEDKIFVIQDIKKYMEFTEKKFLEPVVESII